jgi:16S rRNA (cytosine967-C5)-methyltransferase
MPPLNAVNDQNPRQIAAEVLQHRRPGGGFTEDLLERALARTRLSPVNRALCQELVSGVVRWQAALDWLIARKTDGREQKPGLQNLLRLGLYQIFWLNRIPEHAAVHETVELAKRGGFGSQAGFVNAVLRGYLREAEATKRLLAELKISQPALGWSHPEWLIARWQKRWGARKTAQLLEWNNTPPKTYARVSNLKFGGASVPANRLVSGLAPPTESGVHGVTRPTLKNTGDLLAQWRDENVEYDFVRRDWLEENLVFELKSHPPLASLTSFRNGWFYIQDPSTLLAVTELNPWPGETILDFCAAPGGKTTFIAQLMNNQGRIVAQDVSEERLKLVRENCTRLGVTCVEFCRSRGDAAQNQLAICDLRFTNPPEERARKSSIVNPKSNRPSAIGHLQFDGILVDAPCSNTGVMRRRVDLRWRIQPEEVSRLQQTQLTLLEQATPKLKPGGVLVYSTCSLEPEENSEVVKEFLRGHEEFKLEIERELLPFVDDVDGAFVARLKRLP